MAQEQVNAIIDALKSGYAIRNANIQQANEQQYRQQEIANRKLELAEQKRQFDITTKAAQAMHDLQVQQAEQSLTKEGVSTGIFPPGYSVGQKNAEGISQAITTPSGEIQEVPTHEEYLRQLGATKLAEMKPALDAESTEWTRRHAIEVGDRLNELANQNIYKLEEQIQEQKAQQALANLNGRLRISEIREQIMPTLDRTPVGSVHVVLDSDGAPTVFTHDPVQVFNDVTKKLNDGSISTDQIKKDNGRTGPAMIMYAQQHGVQGLSEANKGVVDSIQNTLPMFGALQKLLILRAKSPYKELNPLADEFAEYNGKVKEVQGYIDNLTSALAGPRYRMSWPTIKQSIESTIPSRNIVSSKLKANVEQYNQVVQHYYALFNTATEGMSEDSRASVLARIGLGKIHPIGMENIKDNQEPVGKSGVKTLRWTFKGGQLVPEGQ